MSYFREYILSITAVLIFSCVTEQAVEEGTWKKYVSFVSGLLLIICMINPITKILGANFSLPVLENENEISSILNYDFIKENTKEDFSKKLEEQIKNDVLKMFNKEISVNCQMDDDDKIHIYIRDRVSDEILKFIDKTYSPAFIINGKNGALYEN